MEEHQERILLDFGRRVRELRYALGVSQEALGDLAGIDRTYVSGVERGRRNATVLTIHKFAAALGVEPADLLRTPESD